MNNSFKTTGISALVAGLLSIASLGQAKADIVEDAYFVNPLPQFPAWRLNR